jgi:hypothetical protein
MKAAPCAAVAIGISVMPGAPFQNPARPNSSVPNFKDYQVPALEVFKGEPAEPRFKTSGQRRFESRIHLAASRGADFAGHFKIAQWGCGTGCVQVAVIDVQLGDVFEGPFGTLPKARISFQAADDDLLYRLDSRLLVARGCPNEKACGAYYYEWTGSQFRLLRQTPIKASPVPIGH